MVVVGSITVGAGAGAAVVGGSVGTGTSGAGAGAAAGSGCCSTAASDGVATTTAASGSGAIGVVLLGTVGGAETIVVLLDAGTTSFEDTGVAAPAVVVVPRTYSGTVTADSWEPFAAVRTEPEPLGHSSTTISPTAPTAPIDPISTGGNERPNFELAIASIPHLVGQNQRWRRG
ncbi:MAG: hypothetical protein ACKV2O_09335 [Acidimicrobiales bacterium]